MQDVNDNDPSFEQKTYYATLSEKDPPGTPVITVHATDPDRDSRLQYHISSGNHRERFGECFRDSDQFKDYDHSGFF